MNVSDNTRRKFIKTTTGAVGASLVAGCVGESRDEEYPSREIRWIVPYGAGGGFDMYSRAIAEFMPEYLPNDVEIVVDNVEGAGGRQGANNIYTADPDGYTLGIWNVPGMLATSLVQETNYDLSEVSWFGRVAVTDYVVSVAADSEYETVEDLENADEVSFANITKSTTAGIATIIATNVMDINANIVTGYDGTPGSITAVLRGDVDVRIDVFDSVKPYVEDGELKTIVALSDEPPEYAPDTPTAVDVGYDELAGAVSLQWMLGGPPGLSEDIVTTLEDAFLEAANTDEMHEFLEERDRTLDPAGREETVSQFEQTRETFEQYQDILSEEI